MYCKFWSVSLEHFIKHKLLFSEEWESRVYTVYFFKITKRGMKMKNPLKESPSNWILWIFCGHIIRQNDHSGSICTHFRISNFTHLFHLLRFKIWIGKACFWNWSAILMKQNGSSFGNFQHFLGRRNALFHVVLYTKGL